MCHIPCRQDQGPPISFVDEEDRQIPPVVCLPKRSVDIFTRPVSFFNKMEVGKTRKNLSDFLLPNTVFLGQFFYDVLKPYKARNLQRDFLLLQHLQGRKWLPASLIA